MAKNKSVFVCQNCGAESPKWIGRCPSCKEWNSYHEEIIAASGSRDTAFVITQERRKPELLDNIKSDEFGRQKSGIAELDRILGGGIVSGSLILLGGEPGVGKSTLALQIALALKGKRILYVSGEESEEQISLRAKRMKNSNPECYILSETELERILVHAENIKPGLIIIDSIQTINTTALESSAGTVSQVRECAAQLLKYSKITGIPVFLIGHITKDGTLAGPKVLEHIVDVVLYFEGDNNYVYRILRSVKNRFGSTSEIGIFEMVEKGLREVDNPSELFINQHDEALSGISIAATVDGLRPFLIETQALVSTAVYGTPQRSSTGFDTRRLNMLLAVLEKRAGFKLGTKDVFLNIAGGIKVNDPAIDLAIISSVLSSNLDIPIGRETCFAGEAGLSGEIRPVSRIEQRIREASKMGFTKIYISKYHRNVMLNGLNIEVIAAGKIEHLVRSLFA
ncbi:MAG: DNA repair protein RadA [Bacteroidetes bacterium GWE2_41_25]|nr:MAG: DNA repair protein RadA [Bacteroidetes bacterium GWA2_40_15]OFX95519.1 MAG: DNA repair protein RadA [Bacteroidetes bacterium GWC2_40_22]OFY10276.1 MAG: DNA repair protein RadA [Bacteroidetes bacterium GWE2_41_25]OFY61757.1 MAG: DNA repair protein RadA [Bacteroidetes bacterium GWF2_41_9]HAM11208.1 DNA repair protein RadA [Bacteroidales bacterium]